MMMPIGRETGDGGEQTEGEEGPIKYLMVSGFKLQNQWVGNEPGFNNLTHF